MIIGKDINPKKQIYYISALIIEELKIASVPTFDFFQMYYNIKKKEDISINLFSLSLDWLYMLGAIKQSGNKLEKCF